MTTYMYICRSLEFLRGELPASLLSTLFSNATIEITIKLLFHLCCEVSTFLRNHTYTQFQPRK